MVIRVLLYALVMVAGCGCAFSGAVADYGKIYEAESEPKCAVLGTDGSVAVKAIVHYRQDKWEPRVRYFVIPAAEIERSIRETDAGRPSRDTDGHTILLLYWRNRQTIPVTFEGPSATEADLPPALREGKVLPWPSGSTRERQIEPSAGIVYEHGDEAFLLVPYETQDTRWARSSVNDAVVRVLWVPAFMLDVLTFPVQFVIGFRELQQAKF